MGCGNASRTPWQCPYGDCPCKDMEEFVGELQRKIGAGDFRAAADLFYLPGASKRPARQPVFVAPSPSEAKTLVSVLPTPLSKFVGLHLRGRWLLQQLHALPSEKVGTAALNPVLECVRDFFNEAVEFYGAETTAPGQGEWLLRAATADFVTVGLEWSRAAAREALEEDRVGDVFHAIKKCFTSMAKKDDPYIPRHRAAFAELVCCRKRAILIFLFGECFRLMFRLRRVGMFPSILTSFQVLGGDKVLWRLASSSVVASSWAGHRCDALNFLYYRAVYEFQSMQLNESQKRFEEAWQLLPGATAGFGSEARARILFYLVAIRLMRGQALRPAMRARYHQWLPEALVSLMRPVMHGAWSEVEAELTKHLHTLTALHLYVHLRLNLQPATFLNLIKQTWKLSVSGQGMPVKIIALRSIERVAASTGWSLPLDEIECLLIHLINKGWIKGHIGHDTGVLVLSVTDPFPNKD